MISDDELFSFIKPYYENKDIMHDLWHIELVQRQVDHIIALGTMPLTERLCVWHRRFTGSYTVTRMRSEAFCRRRDAPSL